MALAVLEALDNARTQWYHGTAIIIAGMGFFTDAYDLFCISTVTKLLGRLYYYNPNTNILGKLPASANNAVVGVALVGTLVGQLVFGYLGDKLGRKKVYGITLMFMVLWCKRTFCYRNTLFLQVLARIWYWWRLSSLGHDHV